MTTAHKSIFEDPQILNLGRENPEKSEVSSIFGRPLGTLAILVPYVDPDDCEQDKQDDDREFQVTLERNGVYLKVPSEWGVMHPKTARALADALRRIALASDGLPREGLPLPSAGVVKAKSKPQRVKAKGARKGKK